ncbi:amidohydrolase family protein [Brucella lupini]|uniref:Amidohydrolase family protein n=1 Tax=Brucella lupini TaxID=255457 RepID=A0A256GCR4_9HYPH|nr:amidohydrolase family protein [Brucella lupini]KAB2698710.1 amidohydrolase family protein [Brucella lupini]OYR24922.1 amidohydrolase family protein [Brucella lupini]
MCNLPDVFAQKQQVERVDPAQQAALHVAVRPDWLALEPETAVDPDQPIIDPHHHLWQGSRGRYMYDECLEDVTASHNIVATVFVECRSMWRGFGPDELRPAGETEFAAGVAAVAESGDFGTCRIAAGIIGYADLRMAPEKVDRLLQLHLERGGGRFRGIRQSAVWHPDPAFRTTSILPPPGLLSDQAFRSGFARLGEFGVSFDAWVYHTQLAEFAELARAYPEVVLVLDHLGGIIGAGANAGMRDEVFSEWRKGLASLAEMPNVRLKLGGLGMRIGFGRYHLGERPPTSLQLAQDWRPWIETAIELMGVDRCMFESNFPVDKGSYSYSVCWNAFQRIASGASVNERRALFHDTAVETYRLVL